MDIPHRWTRRNPRKPDHVQAALALISELAGISVTEQTQKELSVFGLRAKAKLVKPEGEDTIIGSFFLLERGPMFPDNVLTKCNDCGAALEIRPHSSSISTRMCCFCAVDRLLAAHWACR